MSATDHAATQLPLSLILDRLARGRDQEAWTALLLSAGPDMQRLARRIVGEAGLADDVLQEALLQIRDRAGQFHPTPSGDADVDARRWTMRLTANISLKLLRSRHRAQRREQHASRRTPAPTPQEAEEQSEQAEMLRRELASLPEGSGSAIVLHHIGGLSFEEIALELGLPVGTAKTKVRRGLISLRDRLQRAGFAMTLTAIAGGLSGLSAAEGGAALSVYAPLLHSPLKAAGAKLAGFTALKVASIAVLAAAGVAGPTVAWRAHRVAQATAASFPFDFEDNVRPAILKSGQLVAGPDRAGNRFCVAGIAGVSIGGEGSLRVMFEDPAKELVAYRAGMRLSFDYWTTGRLQLYLCDLDQADEVAGQPIRTFSSSMSLVALPQGKWEHVTIDLADLRCVHGPDQGPAPGERLNDIEIVAWHNGPAELYVDNVAITDP